MKKALKYIIALLTILLLHSAVFYYFETNRLVASTINILEAYLYALLIILIYGIWFYVPFVLLFELAKKLLSGQKNIYSYVLMGFLLGLVYVTILYFYTDIYTLFDNDKNRANVFLFIFFHSLLGGVYGYLDRWISKLPQIQV